MAESTYIHVNHTPSPEYQQVTGIKDFSLSAPPKSDIYTSPGPPCLYVYTAPVTCRRIKRDSFVSARVTVTAKWTLQFDQGGLVFTIPSVSNPNPDAANANTAETHPSWVKLGIETNEGMPCISIVGKGPKGWCDWSLVPVDAKVGSVFPVTLELTRFKNALMVWLLKGEDKVLIRKVPWVFLDDESLSKEVLVGIYAAQPDPDDKSGGKDLVVNFSGFAIETSES